MREHLAACAACREAAQDIAATLGMVRAALAAAPAAARLDPAHRAHTLRSPPSDVRARLRALLGLPAKGSASFSLWPGALAKAALILLLPLTIALGLMIPGMKMACRTARESARTDAPQTAPEETAAPGYQVEIVSQPEFAPRDKLATNALAEEQSPASGTVSTSAFDAASEHWNGGSIVHNELPDGGKAGLGMNPEQQAAGLARASALAAEIVKTRVATQQIAAAPPPHPARGAKSDGRPHIMATVATPPPTNQLSIIAPATNRDTFAQPPR